MVQNPFIPRAGAAGNYAKSTWQQLRQWPAPFQRDFRRNAYIVIKEFGVARGEEDLPVLFHVHYRPFAEGRGVQGGVETAKMGLPDLRQRTIRSWTIGI